MIVHDLNICISDTLMKLIYKACIIPSIFIDLIIIIFKYIDNKINRKINSKVNSKVKLSHIDII